MSGPVLCMPIRLPAAGFLTFAVMVKPSEPPTALNLAEPMECGANRRFRCSIIASITPGSGHFGCSNPLNGIEGGIATMSIITKTGDQGTTSLMYNRRVSKCDPRMEACGAVDELSAALGLARCACQQPRVTEAILAVQNDLIALMGELATSAEDLSRYERDGYPRVRPELTCRLEMAANETSAGMGPFRGWALPGNNPAAAALDFARAVCRRAERSIVGLSEQGLLQNAEVLKYLNRLSDLLWLLARSTETEGETKR